ncbi:ubiquitin-related domain-containing protein [Glomus cerebriforme]|uniref:Ubiquitin-related domain-containing protein n=1 Tax=Glomus cerebriforme TaxID=658196 RepID=A0A397T0Z4_9GLOM|nr:ubiquitin-related domain-containing protein [Glomus cerebriforme]
MNIHKLAKTQIKVYYLATMILYVVLLAGKKITLTVLVTDTIRSVKQQIEEREGIPTNIQRFVYLTQEISNEHTLEDYGFQNEGVMYMCMNLFVAILSGKTITLRVFGVDTVEDVKKKILDREGIIIDWNNKDTLWFHSKICLIGIPVDEQRLVYLNKELHDDQKRLIDHNVQNNGTMWLTMRLKGGLACQPALQILYEKQN